MQITLWLENKTTLFMKVSYFPSLFQMIPWTIEWEFLLTLSWSNTLIVLFKCSLRSQLFKISCTQISPLITLSTIPQPKSFMVSAMQTPNSKRFSLTDQYTKVPKIPLFLESTTLQLTIINIRSSTLKKPMRLLILDIGSTRDAMLEDTHTQLARLTLIWVSQMCLH